MNRYLEKIEKRSKWSPILLTELDTTKFSYFPAKKNKVQLLKKNT
jgi:hypothetical protein